MKAVEKVTQAEFARICGVDRSTVHRWLKNRRIEADAQGRIDPKAAERMRRSTESPLPHHQARMAQFEEGRPATEPSQPESSQHGATSTETGGNKETMQTIEKLGAALKMETYKLQKAKAEMANMEVDQKAGLLVERSEVDFVLRDFGNTLRGLIESMPDKLAPSLARHRGDVNAIHAEIDAYAADLLNEFADHMKRKQEEALP